MISVPVRPGRNLSEIIEVAARNRILKMRGVDSARRFQQKLLREISQAVPRKPGQKMQDLDDIE